MTEQEKASALRGAQIFGALPDEVLAAVASQVEQRSYTAGAVLFEKGDPGDGLYLVISGCIRAHDGEHTFRHMYPNDVLGELALMDNEPRSASATAVEPTSVLFLSKDKFFEVGGRHLSFIQAMVALVSHRLRLQNEDFVRIMQDEQDRLTTMVNERTLELMQLIENKEKILNIVSHDIRSPLSGLLGLAGLLQDKEILDDRAEVLKFSQMIEKSLNNVLSFVNDILDYARLQSGIEIHGTKFDLSDYIRTHISSFEPLSITKGVRIEFTAPASVHVQADRSKLSQAVNNLVSNAMKYTDKGGKVAISVFPKDIDQQPFACFSVSDTGKGIPAEAIPNLFDEFTKYQTAGVRGEKGTGLGMSIVKQIVDLHDGRIDVQSEVGRGTTFTVCLPLQQQS